MRSNMILEVMPVVDFIIKPVFDSKLGFIQPRELSEETKLKLALSYGLYSVRTRGYKYK